MTAINRFHKLILCLLIICFTCVVVGSIDTIRSQTIGSQNTPGLSLLVGLSFCLICFMLVWKSFRWLDCLNDKGCMIFSLIVLALMAGVFVLVSFSARVTQFVDSIDVMDTAFYLRKHAEVTKELPYIRYVGSFGNNYPLILFESFLIRILTWLGFQDVENILNHLNVVVLMTAVVLTWLIVKETRGIRTAAKTIVICLLNPYLYLMVNWTYSMTYSLPIMMGILYIALKIKKTTKTIIGIVLAFVEGFLIGGGFLIRVTTVFPLIAAMIVWVPSLIKKKINKKRIVLFLCILTAIIILVAYVNVQIDRKFGKIKSLNMPLSFWLLLGSHGDGAWNDADLDAVMAIQNPEERSWFALKQALHNYGELGIEGTLNLWYRKWLTTWDDGGFFYRSPAVSEGNALSAYFLGSGARNQLSKVYGQAFRLFMIIGFLLACSIALMRRNIPHIVLIMMLTIFGCAVFHTIWETNVRYSIPFILPILTVIEYGMSSAQEYVKEKKLLFNMSMMTNGIVLVGLLIVVCANLNAALKEETPQNHYCIYSSANTRVCATINPADFENLNQDFYTDKPFNTLFFKASLPFQKNKEDCSSYELTVFNDDGQILNRTQLLPEQLGGSGFKVSFETISGYQHYYIKLDKKEPEKESIHFYTQYTYGVDPYKGILTVDGGNAYPSDLMMDVYEVRQIAIYGLKMRIVVIALIILAGGAAFIPDPRRKRIVNQD